MAEQAAARGIAHTACAAGGGTVAHDAGLAALIDASEPDIVLNALVGAAGLRPTLAALERGVHGRARQQGEPGRRRRPRRRRPRAHRRRRWCRSTPSTRRSSSCSTGVAPDRVARGDPHRLRAVRSGAGRPMTWRGSRPADALRAPHLDDGGEDHDRLGHADEQGPRADRGAPPVRAGLRAARGRRAPAVDDPRDGAARRRQRPGPLRPAGHAGADRPRAAPARPAARRRQPMDLVGRRLDFEAPDEDAFPCLGAGPRRPAARAAPPRRC